MDACARCGAAMQLGGRVCRACGKVAAPVVATVGTHHGPSAPIPSAVAAPSLCALAAPTAPTAQTAPTVGAVVAPTVGAVAAPIAPSPGAASPTAGPALSAAGTKGGGVSGAPSAPGKVPPMLWVVMVVLAAVGAATVALCAVVAIPALGLLGQGTLGLALGVFFLLVAAIPFSFGAGCVYIAWRMKAADRLARILAIVTNLGLAGACLLASGGRLLIVFLALVCAGFAATLMFEPSTRRYFTGPAALHGAEPDAVVVARLLMVVVGAAMFEVGLAMCVLGIVFPTSLVYGALELSIGIGVFWTSRRLAHGDRAARVYATCLAVVYALVSLIAGRGGVGIVLPSALSTAVIGLLWLPPSCASYFAGLATPKVVAVAAIDRAVMQAVGGVRGALLQSATPSPPEAQR